MHKVFIAWIALFFISCAYPGSSISNIRFFDSYGKQYFLEDGANEIKENYGLQKAPKTVVIVASDPNSKRLESQLKIVSEIDPEKYRYIYIVGNSKKADKSGYYILPRDSEKLLGGEEFRVIVIGRGGKLLKNSVAILSKDEIIRYLMR